MKNVLTPVLITSIGLLTGTSLKAQLAYMPAPINDDVVTWGGDTEEEVTYNIEEVKDYLPLETTQVFGENESSEDISNYLPLEAPLFGEDLNEEDLPLDSGNGYFLETGLNYTESSYAVYADNGFKEIIVSFDASKEEDIRVNLYNTVGVQIRQDSYNTRLGLNNFSLDIESLPRGLYTLKLTGNKQNIIKKFVIK